MRFYCKNRWSSWAGEVFDTREDKIIAEQNRAVVVAQSKMLAEDDAAKETARRARMEAW